MTNTITRAVLKSVFTLKKNFVPGISPGRKSTDGVEITPFAKGASAAATISADFEIAWAFRGRSEEERKTRGIRAHRNVPAVLAMLQETQVPITWATVGHLFLEHCERGAGGCAHPEMPRPPKNLRWEGDWYRHDPCTNLKTDPDWYAPDLIDQIVSNKVKHEVGSHTFSHIDFSAETSTSELVEHEMQACINVMAARKLSLRSLVYPFNNMGHHYLDQLARLGLTAVRHRGPVRLSYPERSASGVYKLTESMNLRQAKRYDYVEKAHIFLEESMRRQAAFHIWFHPSDPTEVFEREFYGIIRAMAKLRDEGRVWVVTMGELAAYCEARERTQLTTSRKSNELSISLQSNYDAKRYGPVDLTLSIQCDSVPRRAVWIRGGAEAALDWKTDSGSTKGNGRTQILVNVPVNATEVLLNF